MADDLARVMIEVADDIPPTTDTIADVLPIATMIITMVAGTVETVSESPSEAVEKIALAETGTTMTTVQVVVVDLRPRLLRVKRTLVPTARSRRTTMPLPLAEICDTRHQADLTGSSRIK